MVRIYKEKTEEVVRILSEAMKDDTNRIQNLKNMFEPEVKYCYENGIVYATSKNIEGFTGKLLKQTPGSLKQ